MAHVTGSVNTVGDLLTAIQNACTANGWTLSGEVLHKGTAFIRVWVNSADINFQGGTGIDGSNLLTGAGPTHVRFKLIGSNAIAYPVTYEVHLNTSPDEVYVVINYSTDRYQIACWGLSDIPDLPGTGMWFAGTGHSGVTSGDFRSSAAGAVVGNPNTAAHPIFYAKDTADPNGTAINSFVHHDLDARGWSANSTNHLNIAWSFDAIDPLLGFLPNAWNSETVLLPFPVYVPRPTGNTVSQIADLKHIRHIRIDFHDPGDIITLGADQWKFYPWYRKNVLSRNGGSQVDHSGTFGFALRYTGA